MNARTLRQPRACGLLLAALAFPLAGQAASLSTIQINSARITGGPLAIAEDTQLSFSGTAPAAEAARDGVFTVNGSEFSASAYGFASPEALRARSTLSGTSGGAFVSQLHEISVIVTDGLRIDSALYSGQLARVTYTLDISGMLDTALIADGFPIAGAQAVWRLDSGCAVADQCTTGVVGLTPGYSGTQSSPSPGLVVPFGDATGLLSFTIEAAFGLEILITTVLGISTQLLFGNGSEGAFATASADFTNTVVWGGIQSVALQDGTLVTDWTTVSGSGFDYGSATVIPVPAAFWLFGSALLGLAGLRRRR